MIFPLIVTYPSILSSSPMYFGQSSSSSSSTTTTTITTTTTTFRTMLLFLLLLSEASADFSSYTFSGPGQSYMEYKSTWSFQNEHKIEFHFRTRKANEALLRYVILKSDESEIPSTDHSLLTISIEISQGRVTCTLSCNSHTKNVVSLKGKIIKSSVWLIQKWLSKLIVKKNQNNQGKIMLWGQTIQITLNFGRYVL